MNVDANIAELEKRISYVFNNKELVKCALTHSSFVNELKINKWESYQRLEFLGDAVLELVSSEFLYAGNSVMSEGKMSKVRASMVCEPALAFCARKFHLGELILLGKGEETGGGRERNSILSDVFEAIIGAIYQDGGLEEARKFIHKFVLDDVEENQLFVDSKSILQEKIQAQSGKTLRYELVSESGPEHDKTFEVAVYVNEECVTTATGHNKKDAEQQAAYLVLKKMKEE
ncbi:MAG: ribonuclease III [Lachnospiraceae bacterium]|nr:ribonuclease III [Lachnospiraceae bacterium]